MDLEPAADPVDRLRGRLEERLSAHDKAGTVATALAAIESGDLDIATLYERVLTPLMVEVGSRWQSGATPVWEEHLASSTLRTIVEALYPTVRRAADGAEPNGRIALLSCPPDEAHDLGLRMLADRFDMAGWITHFLGADAPGREIAAAAQELGADLIVLSSATHFHRLGVRTLVAELRLALPTARVVVTGAAFCREADAGAFAPDDVLTSADIGPASDGGE